jgi:transposase
MHEDTNNNRLPEGTPETVRSLFAELDEKVRELTATVQQQQEAIGELQGTITKLEITEAGLRRAMFGHRRERFESPDQKLLFEFVNLDEILNRSDDELTTPDWVDDKESAHQPDAQAGNNACTNAEPVDASPDKPKAQRRSHRVLLETLERERREQKLRDEDIPEEHRGKSARRFFKKAHTYVEFVPGTLKLIEEFVEVLAIDNEDQTETTMITAPVAPRIISSLAGPSLLAYLMVSRFFDHLPYYRMEDILDRAGMLFGRGTQSRWMDQLAVPLTPLVELMKARTMQSSVIQADETPVKLIDRTLPGKARTAYFWAVLGDRDNPYATFYFTKNRSRAGPDLFFQRFTGTLLTDAYICYELLSADSLGRIAQAGCFAHARRKFEALDDIASTKDTSTALGYFQRLFSIEDQLLTATDAQRQEIRQRLSRPILDSFKAWMDERLKTLLPKHNLRGPIQYMTKRWDCFTRFLELGAVPLDNNAAERAVKLPVIGKKNWLFLGSERSGHVGATMFTLCATCRRLHINPLDYFKDLFQRIPYCKPDDLSTYEHLLPDIWLAANPDSRMHHREDEADQRAERKRKRRETRWANIQSELGA